MNIQEEESRRKVREFCDLVSGAMNIEARGLIEKDLYLSMILRELQKTPLHEKLVFKGGTCLAKVYLNYHRFSEDLDFTWKDQEMFKGKSMKQVRRLCSGLIDNCGEAISNISEKYGFDFRFEKDNREYVQLGGSNKLVTFLIWLDSTYERRSLIKIQINFLEEIEFPVEKRVLKPLSFKFQEDEERYFRDFLEFYEDLKYYVYDLREIACEKIRTLVTRKIAKTRDILDLYLITKRAGVNPYRLGEKWIKKIKFAIETYKKYRENFKRGGALTRGDFVLDEVDYLLLVEIDKRDFEKFMDEFLSLLNRETKTLLT